MRLNTDKLKDLMMTRAEGNYNRFAKVLNISPGHLYRLINKQIGAGTVTLGKIATYLEKIGEVFSEYIFLP